MTKYKINKLLKAKYNLGFFSNLCNNLKLAENLLDQLKEEGYGVDITREYSSWKVTLINFFIYEQEYSKSLPEAICRAVVKAKRL